MQKIAGNRCWTSGKYLPSRVSVEPFKSTQNICSNIFGQTRIPTYLISSPYLDFENSLLGVLMKWRAAMPSGGKPLPTLQERQKWNVGISPAGDCSKSAEKESKRGSKSKHQKTDSGNLPNALSATPEAQISSDTEACVSQGAAMNQGE